MQQLNNYRVPPHFESIRIDRILAIEFSYWSRSQWQHEIMAGSILCNGISVTNQHKRLRTGDLLSMSNIDSTEPEVDRRYRIIFEDDHLIGIDKPANLPVHPAGIFNKNTLLVMLQNQLQARLYPIHRLDRETSGILIMARTSSAASAVQAHFPLMTKEYLAIVHGFPLKENFTVDSPIGETIHEPIKTCFRIETTRGKTACTHFQVVKKLGEFCLVKAFPKTGRRHQIRIHLQAAGHPIVGDKIYGSDDRFKQEYVRSKYSPMVAARLPMSRSALHAHILSFWHPMAGQQFQLTAPLHEDMTSFIDRESPWHG